jgi:hypothetical protein
LMASRCLANAASHGPFGCPLRHDLHADRTTHEKLILV